MHTDWSTYESFQRGQALLGAINTLVLHLALQPDHEQKMPSDKAVSESVDKLDVFLTDLAQHVSDHERSEPILGIDSRQRQLAERVVEARQRPNQFHSPLVTVGVDKVQALLHADWDASAEVREQLMDSLEDLRAIVEEHLHTDASKLLGEI